MYLMLSYTDGKIVEAVVLSAQGDRMRISIPGYEDVMELRGEQNAWTLETGERVEIESIVLAGGAGTFVQDVRPITLKASGVI